MANSGDFYTYRKDIRPGRGGGSPVDYAIDPGTPSVPGSMPSGQMVGWDTVTDKVIAWVRDGSTSKFVGITRGSQAQILGLGNQAALLLDHISVFTTGVHELLGTAAETYAHGDVVYQNGTTTDKITKTQGTDGVVVGTVHLPDGTTKSGAVRVPILIDEYTKTQA